MTSTTATAPAVPAVQDHITNGTKTVHLVDREGWNGGLYTACTVRVRPTAQVTDSDVTCKTCAKSM